MSFWNRFGFGTTKPLGMGKKAKNNSFRPQLDQLENRVVPAGIKVFMLDGFTGGGLNNTSTAQLVADIIYRSNQVNVNDIAIYQGNWNGNDSTDPGSLDYLTWGPHGIGPFDIITTRILGFDVPYWVQLAPFTIPSPVSPRQQIADLSYQIESSTTDSDFVVLIGHSLGGNTVLKVANSVSREIDLLITLDPVGFSKTPNPLNINLEILPAIGKIEFLGETIFPGTPSVDINVSIPTTFDGLNTEYGWPGSRSGLEGPKNGNVKYFLNRWQESYPFPNDYENDGKLEEITKSNISQIASVGALPVLSQRDASEMLDSTGLNKRYRKGKIEDWVFGKTHPEITYNNYIPDNIKLDKVNANKHGGSDSVVIDDFVQAEIKATLKALTPMNPIVDAGPNVNGVLEGSTTTVTNATASDQNPNDTLTYSWTVTSWPNYVNKNGIKINDSNTLNPKIYVPDNGNYTFTIVVSDGMGSVSDSFEMTAENVSPTVIVTNVPNIVIQFDFSLGVSVFDPGIFDNPLVNINFGDGTPVKVNLTAKGPFNHTYLNSGVYTISVIATDKDGGVGTAVQNVTVKSFGIINNPITGNPMLAVGGTPGVDIIRLNTLDGVIVSGTVNGEVIGPEDSSGVNERAVGIRTGDGNDSVTIGLNQGQAGVPTLWTIDMGAGKDIFSSFSNSNGAAARAFGGGHYQYSYFGGGHAFVSVTNAEAPLIEPNRNDSFVGSLYHKLLERNPSKAEVKAWSKQFARETHEYIAHNIFYSVERSAKTVSNWYTTYLGRTPTAAEAKPWIKLVVAGKNEELTLAKFLGSKEYIVKQGTGTGYIQSLYGQFLGRIASQAAVDSWFKDFGNPLRYENVAKAVLTSKEYQTREITSYYDRFLDRNQIAQVGFADPNAFSRNGVGPKEVSDWLFARVSPHAARYQMSWHPEFVNNGL